MFEVVDRLKETCMLTVDASCRWKRSEIHPRATSSNRASTSDSHSFGLTAHLFLFLLPVVAVSPCDWLIPENDEEVHHLADN